MIPPALPDEDYAEAATLCDRLASHPLDPDKPKEVAGVHFDRLDSETGNPIQHCTTAAAHFSDVPRYKYQLARILEKKKSDPRSAFANYRHAADKGHPLANRATARLFLMGYGVEENLNLSRKYIRASNIGEDGIIFTPTEALKDALDFLDVNISCDREVTIFEGSASDSIGSGKLWFVGNQKTFVVKERTESTRYYNDGRPSKDTLYEYFYTAKYADFDPNIDVKGTAITITCTVANCIMSSILHEGSWSSAISSKQSYRFCSDDIAKRIANALSHLISANGGRKPRF